MSLKGRLVFALLAARAAGYYSCIPAGIGFGTALDLAAHLVDRVISAATRIREIEVKVRFSICPRS